VREAFLKSLFFLAESNSEIMLLTADLGYGVFEDFEKKFPNQYLNVGVAEQNMTSIASGLALEGKIIFTYSIGNFPTLRCLEQIRNDACYHELNINIISSGGGFSYGGLGMSHHATEDIAIMRALPGVKIIVPSTEKEAEIGTIELCKNKGVGYLRLDKSKVQTMKFDRKISIGKSNILRSGNDITIIAAGGIAEEALKAADILSKSNIECRVISIFSIKPIDICAIESACIETNGIITIEEGNLSGGLGSAISEVCMDNGYKPKIFKRFGLHDKYSSVVGSQKYLRSIYNITFKEITEYLLRDLDQWQK
jgi:transketolase